MIIKKKNNNRKKMLVAILATMTVPWLAVGVAKMLPKILELIHKMPAWQQTATWVSLIGVTAIVAGYFLYQALRRLAIARVHQMKDKPRKLGVGLFGGGFTDIASKISTDPELKFKAVAFAFIPRSIKGDKGVSTSAEPFPCVFFPVREAVGTWNGAVDQRRKEEPGASNEYINWVIQHKEIVARLDIVGKGEGFTGLSCLHTWRWIAKPEVFRFLIVVFDPVEANTQGETEDDVLESEADIEDDVLDLKTEKEEVRI